MPAEKKLTPEEQKIKELEKVIEDLEKKIVEQENFISSISGSLCKLYNLLENPLYSTRDWLRWILTNCYYRFKFMPVQEGIAQDARYIRETVGLYGDYMSEFYRQSRSKDGNQNQTAKAK